MITVLESSKSSTPRRFEHSPIGTVVRRAEPGSGRTNRAGSGKQDVLESGLGDALAQRSGRLGRVVCGDCGVEPLDSFVVLSHEWCDRAARSSPTRQGRQSGLCASAAASSPTPRNCKQVLGVFCLMREECPWK